MIAGTRICAGVFGRYALSKQTQPKMYWGCFMRRIYSSDTPVMNRKELTTSIWGRFKKTYKTMLRQYGKTIIIFHGINSFCWFFGLWISARHIDLKALVQRFGASDTFADKIEPKKVVGKIYERVDFPAFFRKIHLDSVAKSIEPANMENLAIVLVLYKLVSPLRYLITIVGTPLTVRVLRNFGYMSPAVPKGTFKGFFNRSRIDFQKFRVHRKASRRSRRKLNGNGETAVRKYLSTGISKSRKQRLSKRISRS